MAGESRLYSSHNRFTEEHAEKRAAIWKQSAGLKADLSKTFETVL